MEYWPNTLSIFKDSYKSENEYRKALSDARQHYSFEVRVEGGYKFFTYSTDLDTWKKQK